MTALWWRDDFQLDMGSGRLERFAVSSHWGAAETHLSVHQRYIFNLLIAAAPGFASTAEVCAALYDDGRRRPCLYTKISDLRERLQPVGLTIKCVSGRGYRLRLRERNSDVGT